MKTLIKVLTIGCMALAVKTASADILYWMVSTTDYTFNYAKIGAKDGDGDVEWLYAAGSDHTVVDNLEYWVTPAAKALAGAESDIDAGLQSSDYTFLIELYNAEGTKVAWSKSGVAWSKIQTAVGLSDNPYDFGGSQVIPEPCTGLLGLLGLGVIGLRKRFKKAKKA